MSRKKKLYSLGLPLLLLGVLGGLAFWYGWPYAAMPIAKRALKEGGRVSVEEKEWISFRPAKSQPDLGFIFYPGARVNPKSYAPLARDIAESGYRVVVVPMPLNFAFLAWKRAKRVIDEFSSVEKWVVGGHSLGGSMAARFAVNYVDLVDGLVLWASYPAKEDDLSGAGIPVLSISATRDGVIDRGKVERRTANLLPQGVEVVKIEGGNHSQFGYYGFQRGDMKAEISREKQVAAVVEATKRFLAAVKERGRVQ